MPVPTLIHPVPVKLRQISRSTTFYDDDAREPIQHATRLATKTIQGQVSWKSQFDIGHNKAGTVLNASGYVLFRKIDLDAQSIVLQDNDRIIQIGTRDTDVYINKLVPTGHYPDIGGHTMIKAFFADRAPSKQTRGG